MLKLLKYLCLIFLMTAVCLVYAADDVKVYIAPEEILEEEDGTLNIALPVESSVPDISLPKVEGLQWTESRGSSRQITLINGKQSGTLTLQFGFTPTRTGKITIPAFEISLKSGKTVTKPLTFEVRKAPDYSAGADVSNAMAFARLAFSEQERKTYYAGEKISVELRIFVRAPFALTGSPQGSIIAEPNDAAKIHDDSAMLRQKVLTLNNRQFFCYFLRKNITLQKAGTLQIKTRLKLTISDDNYGFFGDIRKHTVSATLPVTVSELPAPPADDVTFSGLIGTDFSIKPDLSPAPFTAGEPLTLKMTLQGKANFSMFRLPDIQLENFRVYSPEVNPEKDAAKISVTLLPLKSGKIPLNFNFSVFDRETAKYQKFGFSDTLDIKPGNTVTMPAAASTPLPATVPATEPQENSIPDDIGYLMPDSPTLTLPLIRNAVFPCSAFVIAAVLIFLVFLLVYIRKRTLEKDPEYGERMAALAKKKNLLKRLKNMPETGPDSALTEDLTAYLNAVLSLAPGTSLSEIADKIENRYPELAEGLHVIAATAWSPLNTGNQFGDAFRKKILKALAKLSIILLTFCLCIHATADEKTAAAAYDKGDYKTALQEYQKNIQSCQSSAAANANIAKCCYRMNDLPRALVFYERAHLLAPRNAAIRNELNLVRRKLELQEAYLLRSPADLPTFILRFLRADEWCILAAIFLLLTAVSAGCALIMRKRLPRILAILAAVFMTAALLAAFYQNRNENRENRAVSVNPTVLKNLPTDTSDNGLNLPAGTLVTISEERAEMTRVLVGNREGWVRSADLMMFRQK